MLTKSELLELLTDLESDRIERTESTDKTDKFSQAVCAFANDFPHSRQPGYLMLGVRDNGELSGLKVSDRLLQNLAALRSDGNIQPLPAITVSKFSLVGGDVAVVAVQPADLPPVRYKGQIWLRIGPRKATASEQEERILTERRTAHARTFDASPCLEATLRDLSLGLFDAYRREILAPEIIEENNRDMKRQLASLHFYDIRQDCPTYAGILLFAKNPRFFLPGAYIQYLRFSDNEFTDIPVDQAEISGDLQKVLRELDLRLKVNITSTLQQISALREKSIANYPEWAIRELIMNAVMHRNYDSTMPIRFYWFADRVEIVNSGGLYGEAADNFPIHNSYRNLIIAEAMKVLGYVNRYGYGVSRAQRLLQENGNPSAIFKFDAHSVAVKVFRRHE